MSSKPVQRSLMGEFERVVLDLSLAVPSRVPSNIHLLITTSPSLRDGEIESHNISLEHSWLEQEHCI